MVKLTALPSRSGSAN